MCVVRCAFCTSPSHSLQSCLLSLFLELELVQSQVRPLLFGVHHKVVVLHHSCAHWHVNVVVRKRLVLLKKKKKLRARARSTCLLRTCMSSYMGPAKLR